MNEFEVGQKVKIVDMRGESGGKHEDYHQYIAQTGTVTEIAGSTYPIRVVLESPLDHWFNADELAPLDTQPPSADGTTWTLPSEMVTPEVKAVLERLQARIAAADAPRGDGIDAGELFAKAHASGNYDDMRAAMFALHSELLVTHAANDVNAQRGNEFEAELAAAREANRAQGDGVPDFSTENLLRMGVEAADKVIALKIELSVAQQRIAELEAALEPFAEDYHRWWADDHEESYLAFLERTHDHDNVAVSAAIGYKLLHSERQADAVSGGGAE